MPGLFVWCDCLAVLRRAVELGVNLIDAAESYGPHVSELLVAAALLELNDDEFENVSRSSGR
jgi:aryl-alcohol dehydrogenase-like predicted oxidoreductase